MSQRQRTPHSVGLNAHLLSLAPTYRGAGINGYISQLLRNLPSCGDDLRYTAYLYEPAYMAPAAVSSRLSVEHTSWDTRSPLRRIVWEQTALAQRTRRHDLLHGLAFATPILACCPTVVTVHDLSFLRYPAAFRPFNRAYLTFIVRRSARRAARIITVSESTRQDVISFLGAPAERVIAVPNGVGEEYCPAQTAQIEAFRQRKKLPERFILFLGTLEPRKNLIRLIDAYARWRSTDPASAGVRLMIGGGKGWYYDQVFARVQEHGLAEEVIFPGFIPADELVWWYRAATVFVYPSLYEGFGLPVLEAMACGTPVVTSTASSLPEVAGDAGVLVDPTDIEGLADALAHVLGDWALASHLAAAGLRRAAAFSWQRTAAATADVYRNVLGEQREA